MALRVLVLILDRRMRRVRGRVQRLREAMLRPLARLQALDLQKVTKSENASQ
jgi:hypothetical protein